MAWVALDRAIKSVERLKLDGPIDRWRTVRQMIHDDVCRRGYNEQLHSFVQSYGGQELDAALLMIPLAGFLPPEDPRVVGTIAAVEHNLMVEGFVRRCGRHQIRWMASRPAKVLSCRARFGWRTAMGLWAADAMPNKCSSDCCEYAMILGPLSEEYDPVRSQLLGNFPQALSHIAACQYGNEPLATRWLSSATRPRAENQSGHVETQLQSSVQAKHHLLLLR